MVNVLKFGTLKCLMAYANYVDTDHTAPGSALFAIHLLSLLRSNCIKSNI